MRPTRRHVALALLLSAAGLLAAACSIERNYRTLSFFFDGVPDPNAPVEERPQPQPLVDFRNMPAEERAKYLANKVVAPKVTIHEPVREKLCDRCHVFPPRAANQASWMAGIPKLRYPIGELCLTCHEVPEAPYVHGPVGAGECAQCHSAHQSTYPHLLRTERIEQRCRSCHQGEFFQTQVEHGQYGDLDCATCHDPHSADNGKLLREDWEGLWKAAEQEQATTGDEEGES